MLIYNDDSTQPLSNLRPGHALEDLKQWAGWIMDTPVGIYVCHAASPDICFYNSKAGETYGSRPQQQWGNAAQWMMAHAMQELHAEGTDLVRAQAEVVHARGRRFLAAIRMSDAHYAWGSGFPADPLFPTFVHDNPQWRLLRADGSPDFFMDYSVPEVRAHRFGIVKELVEYYPIDGFEFDFMRFCRHFPVPATGEHIELMTQFLRDVRALCDSCDRPMTIGARVPATLAECAPHGLDPQTWAREGLTDYLAPCHWLFADFSIPLDDYLAATGGTDCQVLFPIQPRTACTWAGGEYLEYDRTFPMELAEFRALAATGYAAGAHGLHCFNLNCELPGRRGEMQKALNAIATPQGIVGGPQHYQHLPAEPPDSTGMSGTNRWQYLKFSPGENEAAQTFYFQSGMQGNPRGKMAWRIFGALPQDQWMFQLNGEVLASHQIAARWQGAAAFRTGYGSGMGAHMVYEMDTATAPALRARNRLEITPLFLEPGLATPREMKVLEVQVES